MPASTRAAVASTAIASAVASTAIASAVATRSHVVVDSPIGPLTLVAEDGDLAAVFMQDHRHAPDPERFGPPEPGGSPGAAVLAAAERQLGEYFAGERTEFDLPLSPRAGTEFQRRVWAALREIPYGETVSYGELARRIGAPAASRAVGLANGRNPISIVVPCHRVIGSTGRLTGYGGGLDRKQALLELERRTGQLPSADSDRG